MIYVNSPLLKIIEVRSAEYEELCHLPDLEPPQSEIINLERLGLDQRAARAGVTAATVTLATADTVVAVAVAAPLLLLFPLSSIPDITGADASQSTVGKRKDRVVAADWVIE